MVSVPFITASQVCEQYDTALLSDQTLFALQTFEVLTQLCVFRGLISVQILSESEWRKLRVGRKPSRKLSDSRRLSESAPSRTPPCTAKVCSTDVNRFAAPGGSAQCLRLNCLRPRA